jgi:predicted TIM-barrel fold metal-dependent hydrolase
MAVAQWGFRGIKVHRADAPISREVCEVARALSLPILYDVMGEVSQVVLLAREYPSVSFVIPHLGSFADDWRAQDALIDMLKRFPNVFADTAGVRRFDLLEEAVRRGGANKILFGSDGPYLHPGVELAKIRALALPANQETAVLGGTLLSLIHPHRPDTFRNRRLEATDETKSCAKINRRQDQATTVRAPSLGPHR